MKIGYARTSTTKQHLDQQIEALKEAGCEKIFADQVSGRKVSRPELDKLKAMLRAGDTLVITRWSRLGRSVKNLTVEVTELAEREVNLISLYEGADTTKPMGKMIFHFFAMMAEYQADTIREDTHKGLASARARGRFGGRPKKLNDKQVKRMKELYESKEMTVKEIRTMFGISKGTFYKYV